MTVYKLPEQHVKSFRLRLISKYWAQAPPCLLWFYCLYSGQFLWSALPLAAFLGVRYYSKLRYPFISVFESYYVEQLELSPCLSDVRITWASPKEPKHFTVPLDRFKPVHFLDHKLTTELDDHIPFPVLEAGFDDNTVTKLYRTVFFQVSSCSQQSLLDKADKDKELSA